MSMILKEAMKLAAAVAVVAGGVAIAPPANASLLTVSPLADADVVPQSASDPCIICATTQAHNPIGFGYNNFDSTGNDSSFNLFSSNVTGSFANGDDLTVTPYTGAQLTSFLQGLGDLGLTFGVAVDVNSTGAKSEVLELFRLLDLDQAGTGPLGSRVLFDLASPFAMPDIRNGNGSADYLISGFNLASAGILPGDRLLFQASWDHAVDGGESFYLVPRISAVSDVPIPAALPMFGGVIAGAGALGVWRKRKHGSPVAAS
jgi:hypothetical protein